MFNGIKRIAFLAAGVIIASTVIGCNISFPSKEDVNKVKNFYDNNLAEHVETIKDFDYDSFIRKYLISENNKINEPWIVLNDNMPEFGEDEITTREFERYSPLDELGRCGQAFANISPKTMPTEERGNIGMVKPAGWHTVKYDCVDGEYLYNRCHLIGYQLAGENANTMNLITGTRYLNINGMLDFENQIADYVKNTKNHVLYRVTPIYDGDNLLCNGVQMEAYSVEDNGNGICFNIFAYNIQPGIEIDYATGESHLAN